MQRQDRLIAVGLAAATIALAWNLAALAGVTAVPRTDDWGFAREAFDLHRTGGLHLIGWGPMTKIGHLLWAQPFLWVLGDHQWALAISESVLVAAGVIAAYSLSRRRLPPLQSAVVIGLLLIFPGIVRDTVSYMTDPVALAMQLVTLACGATAIRHDGRSRVVWIWAAMGAGFWAFSIRELAVAAPVAVLTTLWFAAPAERRHTAIAGAVWAAACGGLWWWHRGLAGVDPYAGRPDTGTVLTMLVGGTLTVGVALAPALAWSLPRWWHARHLTGRAIGAGIGIGVVVARPMLADQLGVRNWWLVGDYLQPDGINGGKLLLGAHTQVLPPFLWAIVVTIGCVSTVVIGALLGEWVAVKATTRALHPDPVSRLAGTHAGVTAALLVLTTVWNSTLFDRYLWPLVFTGSLVLLWRDPAPERELVPRVAVAGQYVGAVVTGVAVTATLLLTLHSNAFDAARWDLAERLVAEGTPAEMIDAGTEWAGSHSTSPNAGSTPAIDDPLVAWWTALTSMPQVCRVITNEPITSSLGTEVLTEEWNTWLLFGDSTLHVYALGDPACTDG